MVPAAMFEQSTGKIINMQPLHDNHDCVLGLVIEPGADGAGEPVPYALARAGGHGLVRFHWVIDDNDIAAAASERATDRGGVAEPTTAGFELGFGILSGNDGCRK